PSASGRVPGRAAARRHRQDRPHRAEGAGARGRRVTPVPSEELRFDHSPFMRFLGLEIVRAEKGLVEIRLPFREEFIRHDGSAWPHGGVVSALARIAGAYGVGTEAHT